MKTLKLIAVGIILFVSSTSNAQISINLNIGTPPVYHHTENVVVEYYYLPDIETYYDVRACQYVYLDGGSWIRTRNLPYQYRNYDARNGYRVSLNDYHGHHPYQNFNNDRRRYYEGYRGENHSHVMNRNYDRKEYHENNHEDDHENNRENWKENRYASNDRNQKGHYKHENHGRR
ncbi:hypothetical protein [Flavobacterium cellulosilyticum]|uniref:DUF3300 domain-containing protein n=1 Tax=Flavobacterium cellulosilyticum TaxID=2541731 RepID=A0A4V2Z060_9FLAO|nr:hypothetical protein [Flavobacterium cellulosilyticum]TDD99737.1 hypothetical protein E0F76_03170 [Flavobacterium cellulosilyticum]